MRDGGGELGQKLRYDGVWWRKLAALGATYGPEQWKRYSPPMIGATCFTLLAANRRGAIANMRHIFPEGGPNPTWAALEMFVEFSFCISETLERFGPRPLPVRVDLPPRDLVRDAIDAGTGAIVLTGHLGNWEIASLEMLRYERPVHLVMAPEQNASSNPYVRQLREKAWLQITYSDGSPLSSLTLLQALRRSEVVALQIDRLPSSASTVSIPFFGRPTRFPAGPFELARVSGAPLVSLFAPRRGTRHYQLIFGQPRRVTRAERGTRLIPIMTSVVAELEAMIRAYPNQWFQFAPFWAESAAAPQAPVLEATGDDSLAQARSSASMRWRTKVLNRSRSS